MNWDEYYLNICKTIALNSKCFSRKIGSIIVKDKSIISTGYNGPPRGVPTCPERWSRTPDDFLLKEAKDASPIAPEGMTIQEYFDNTCPRRVIGYPSGEGLHICIAGHAERNALINAARHGIAVKDATLYLDTYVPCSPCMIEIINAGIKEIVCTKLKVYDGQVQYLIDNSHIKLRTYNIDK